MTDYLDQLLEQQEQDERGDVPEWRSLSGRVYAGERYRAADPVERTAGHRGLVMDEEPQRDGRASAAGLLTQQLERLHRAVRQVQERPVQAAGAVQGAAQPMAAGGFHTGPLAVRRAADYAAAVDAAFQRDARRYDGPLGLL